jgi:RNA polymerase-binding protein DksA
MVVKRTLSAARQTAAKTVESARNAVGRGTQSETTPATEPATKTTAKKAPAKTSASTKTAAKKTTAKKTATKKAPAKTAAKKTTAKKSATKKAPMTKTSRRTAKAAPSSLPVRSDESPWTEGELREVRTEIENDIIQLRAELEHAESDLVDLMRDSGDGAGDDQADAGAKTYEREQEISLANNAREMLRQNQHALERLDNGTYGICESCGNPIGKLRLQAAPRATLCMPCKTQQERR